MDITGIEFDLAEWHLPQLEMDLSAIQGQGVFTLNTINTGEVVFRFGGRLYPSEARFDRSKVQAGTAVGLSDSVIIAQPTSVPKDLSDFINHSCESNLGMRDAITLVAKRPISPGSEVTADYAYWETEGAYRMNSQCKCGFSECRGVISGSDWRRPEGRQDLLLWASPFVRRRVMALDRAL